MVLLFEKEGWASVFFFKTVLICVRLARDVKRLP